MEGLVAVSRQLTRIVFGYIAACLAAALFATVAVVMNAPALGEASAPEVLLQVVLLGWVGTTAIALTSCFLPAGVVALFAEAFGARSPFVYLAAGAVIAVLPPLAELDVGRASLRQLDFDFASFFLACGLVAGLVYWMVAGRRAGRWQQAFVLDLD